MPNSQDTPNKNTALKIGKTNPRSRPGSSVSDLHIAGTKPSSSAFKAKLAISGEEIESELDDCFDDMLFVRTLSSRANLDDRVIVNLKLSSFGHDIKVTLAGVIKAQDDHFRNQKLLTIHLDSEFKHQVDYLLESLQELQQDVSDWLCLAQGK